jgi:hypothetical protein
MFTSYFGNLKNIPPVLEPVCIARGKPRFVKFNGRVELALAPTPAMLKMPRDQFDAAFAAQLATLDPKEIQARLGDNAVLLCWEKPGEGCHRRIVAEWLEAALGIVIPELGLKRSETKAYDETPWKAEKPAKKPVGDLFS